ncbi:MAG: hypothetical protein E6I68_01525 [Chloroflexi bacterium]|nr:MAG: hypothetical protein E6I68_01525 [Chloroflexota bacterium]
MSEFELSGLILQAREDAPYVVRYRIRVDQSWSTRGVEVEIENGGSRSLRLSINTGGHWSGKRRCLSDGMLHSWYQLTGSERYH